jgi:hypothetical protein
MRPPRHLSATVTAEPTIGRTNARPTALSSRLGSESVSIVAGSVNRHDCGMDIVRLIKRAKEIYSWYNFAAGVCALAITGIGISVGGAVWLVKIGIPLPLAMMAGFCTLVGAVYLAMAPAVYRVLLRTGVPPQSPVADAPNYEAWRHVDRFTLNQAAHLWCDLDPDRSDTFDTSAWVRAFAAAIRKGQLKSISVSGPLIVTRDALKDFARLNKYDPRFLRDG